MKRIIFAVLLLFTYKSSFGEVGWWWNRSDKIDNKYNGNHYSQSFYAVKKEMLEKIYYDHRYTLYCNLEFNRLKQIKKIAGFKIPDIKAVDFMVYDITTEELQHKSERMEWEHIVPAQNFGKTFTEWSKGHRNCVSGKGKKFKGRSCAEQENEEFRYMYTDMYNLYPAIGAVNYLRANFSFTQFDEKVKNTFGTCAMKISHNKAEPPDEIKGFVARVYLYMQRTYPRYSIGEPAYSVLKAWNKKYAVSQWECQRAYRIEQLQGNADHIVKKMCQDKHWYHN